MTLTPSANHAASVSIGKLTIENGTDRVAFYGSLDITRDQQGLAHARALPPPLFDRTPDWPDDAATVAVAENRRE